MKTIRKIAALLCAGWLLALVVAPQVLAEDSANARKLDVMSANLYLGADIFRVVGVQPAEIPFTVAEIFATVQATNFPERAEAIADSIMQRSPHVIGLQEVSWYRTGAFDPSGINAEDTVYDFLALLMEALDARGLDYRVAGLVTNADVEAPMFDGSGLVDLRLTDRDVVLVRGDVASGMPVANNFALNASFPLGPEEVTFLRGYVMVPITLKDQAYLFVTTHLETRLESFAPFSLGRVYQTAQAMELLGTVDFLNATVFGNLPVVLTGDLNSDPNDQPVTVPPGIPGIPFDQLVPPYQILTLAGQFTDSWTLRQGPMDSGETCCHDEGLDNAVAAFYERIDHVMVRGLPGELGPVQSQVLNEELADKTASGLWPSDHGFVSTSIKLKQLKH